MTDGSQLEAMEKTGRYIGTVLAIGPQAYVAHASALFDYAVANDVDPGVLEPWCEVGEMVVYQRNAGKFVWDPMSGEELYVIHDEDVIAAIPPEEEWEHDIRMKRL